MTRNFSLTLFAITAFSLSAIAQTPVPDPALTGVSAWPTSADIHPGTRLLVTTLADPDTSYQCRLRSLDADHLTCAEPRGSSNIVFDRLVVSTLMLAPHHSVRVSNIIMGAGAGCLLVAWVVAVHQQFNNEGGTAADFAEAGVNLGVAGAITHIFDGHHGPPALTPLYIAPHPARVESPAPDNPID